MGRSPLILISPGIEKRGVEFSDLSVSLALRYETAILAAGGIPVIAPVTTDRGLLAEAVRRTDGVMLTGGDDIDPDLYDRMLHPAVRRTVEVTPDNGGRDERELLMIQETFRRRKPLLAICRGHQLLNIAFGGGLVVDLRQQFPSEVNHRQMDKACELVHQVALTPGSLVAKICGRRSLGVNSTHHQGVAEPATPFVATGRSLDGLVEVMELKPELAAQLPFLLSVQFHPERLVQRGTRYLAIFQKFVTACTRKGI